MIGVLMDSAKKRCLRGYWVILDGSSLSICSLCSSYGGVIGFEEEKRGDSLRGK